jgi:hypothetical protein
MTSGRTSDILNPPASSSTTTPRRMMPSLERLASGFSALASSASTVLEDGSEHGDAVLDPPHNWGRSRVGVPPLRSARAASDGTLDSSPEQLASAGSRTRRAGSDGPELRDNPRVRTIVKKDPAEKEGAELRDTPRGRRMLRTQERVEKRVEAPAAAKHPMAHMLRRDFADHMVEDMMHTSKVFRTTLTRRGSHPLDDDFARTENTSRPTFPRRFSFE